MDDPDARPRKRVTRAAAANAARALQSVDLTIAELTNVHPRQSVALTAQNVLDAADADVLCRGMRTLVVTLHTNERPKKLPRETIHIGAAFDDTAAFEDTELLQTLARMAAKVWSANTPRVVFVCQAGVNRSALALCFYICRHGSCGWQQTHAAIVSAKGEAAGGWPTLANAAFVALLQQHCSGSPTQPTTAAPTPRWFWRTVATARPSTGGKGADPEDVKRRRLEWEASLREAGTDPKRGRTWGCWLNGRQRGTWIRGVPNQPRPW